MKKLLATLVAVSAVVMAGSAFAASIVGTKHDLSFGNGVAGGYSAGNSGATQVCVYCHTPHNSAKTKALWNRKGATADTAFATYTSGIMMEGSVADGWFQGSVKGQFSTKSTSLLCMTCHDGATTMGGATLNNQPYGLSAAQSNVQSAGVGVVITGAANLGTDLTNDHPVNIDYAKAVVTVNNARPGSLADTTAATGLPFQNGIMECSSCHNVHDNAIAPFLRGSLAGSGLCLKCHIK
ncbi:cytochrome c3 family protein [Geotalea uraniireducens]|uniref:Doubled CXXCH motif domain-containing protein n=1 Tax=Geotalea uraniireducens (strain Rf4) TaxID=351605 RepID=A5G869_GEOUR|nr:cytochrome c3 family protein [Geotalea uraniireducens]ABQ27987.1 hypothetical protein Gura_3837 [Geotalea uraniireducens Rf4]